ncbi:hypothetical protein LXL04_034521 [Taraxacum kok-saghyz]
MASQEHDRETAGDQPPLWGYVTKLEKLSGTGGGWSFKCNFCSETQKGSYYRVRAHLIGEKSSVEMEFNGLQSVYMKIEMQEPHRLLQAADKTLKTMVIEFAESQSYVDIASISNMGCSGLHLPAAIDEKHRAVSS